MVISCLVKHKVWTIADDVNDENHKIAMSISSLCYLEGLECLYQCHCALTGGINICKYYMIVEILCFI